MAMMAPGALGQDTLIDRKDTLDAGQREKLNEQVRILLDDAKKFEREGNYPQVMKTYQELAVIYQLLGKPTLYIQNKMVDACLRIGRYQEAVSLVDTGIYARSGYPYENAIYACQLYYAALGCQLLGDFKRAARYYERGIREYPDEFIRPVGQFMTGQLSQDQFVAWIKKQPKIEWNGRYYDVAEAWLAKQNRKKARFWYDMAQSVSKSKQDLWYILATQRLEELEKKE
jgi:tetratricopeptide (TPR) repeat protein